MAWRRQVYLQSGRRYVIEIEDKVDRLVLVAAAGVDEVVVDVVV